MKNKIKLITIFILILLLALMAKALYDYKIISTKLISEVNTTEMKIQQLQDENEQLNKLLAQQEIEYKNELDIEKQKCVKEEDLSLRYLNNNENIDHNISENNNIEPIINNENKITGYGLEYLQPVPNDSDNNNEDNNEYDNEPSNQ